MSLKDHFATVTENEMIGCVSNPSGVCFPNFVQKGLSENVRVCLRRGRWDYRMNFFCVPFIFYCSLFLLGDGFLDLFLRLQNFGGITYVGLISIHENCVFNSNGSS